MLSGLKSRKFEASAIALLLGFVSWGCFTKDAEASMAMQKRTANKRDFVVTVRIAVVFPKSYGPASEKDARARVYFLYGLLPSRRRFSLRRRGRLFLFRS